MKISIRKIVVCAALLGFTTVHAQTVKDAIKMTESERYEAATSAFKKLIKNGDEQGGDTWFYYGDNFLQWSMLDSAKMMFQKGADSKPSNPLNFVGLGSVSWREGSGDAAKQAFYKAISLTTTQAKELPKDKQVMVYLKIADAYMQASTKNLPDAFTNINAAMKVDPKNPEVYLSLGDYWALKNVTDVSEAIKNYEKAGEMDKTSTKAMIRLGKMWVGVQNREDGLKLFNQAIKMDSTFAPAFHARGDLLLNIGKYDRAISDYRKYLSMNDGITAREKYVAALFLAKNYTVAISEGKEIQKKDSSSIRLYRIMGYSYFENNEFPAGVEAMEKFFRKQKVKNYPPLDRKDFSYYGKLLGKTGKDSLGVEQIKIAIKMDTSYTTEGYGDMGNIYFKAKKYADAAKYYQMKIAHSAKLNPGDFGALGQSYYWNKEYLRADSAFMKITDSYPVYAPAWRGRCWEAQEAMEFEAKPGKDKIEKPEKGKPYFDLVIKNAGTDIERNKKDLIDAYVYLSRYYYLTTKNYDCTKAAALKIQELKPDHPLVKIYMEDKFVKPANADNCKWQ